jgi:hypothetical protein
LSKNTSHFFFYLESCTTDFFLICRDSSDLVLGVLIALEASKGVRVEATYNNAAYMRLAKMTKLG